MNDISIQLAGNGDLQSAFAGVKVGDEVTSKVTYRVNEISPDKLGGTVVKVSAPDGAEPVEGDLPDGKELAPDQRPNLVLLDKSK